jgi:Uma2 family endonuclease
MAVLFERVTQLPSYRNDFDDASVIPVVDLAGRSRIVARDHLQFTRRAEQTMGMPAVEGRWTREEVLDLIARNPLTTPRYELVDGVLLVTPSPSGMHQIAVGKLYVLLTAYLDSESAVGEAFHSPSDVEPEPGATVGPDVFVVPPDEAKRIRRERPVRRLILAVEMLSPGDRSGDRGRKRELYQRTIPEYWIVDNPQRHIDVWRPGFDVPTILRDVLEWHPAGASRPFVLDVPGYFAMVYGEAR